MILIIWNSFVPKKSRESKHILFSPIRITCELKRMYLEWYCIFSQEHEFLIAQSREVPNQIASFLSSELSSLHSVSMLSTPGNANLEKSRTAVLQNLILHPLTPPRQILTEWRDLLMVELYARPVPDRLVHGIDFSHKETKQAERQKKSISQQIRVSYAQPVDAKWRPPASGGISIGRPVQCKENFAVRSRLSIEVANKKGRSSSPYWPPLSKVPEHTT